MTLVEVLVALAVMGAVVAAVISLISQNTRFVTAAEDRLLAGIAADNAMIERLASDAPLETGEETREIMVGARTFAVTEAVTETGAEGLLRVDITVLDATGRQSLAHAMTITAEARR